MSGQLSTRDAPDTPQRDEPHVCDVEVLDGRSAEVGGFGVRRLLPRRARRTVGAWCFADHMGPGHVSPRGGLDIGPHPHIGLQTVTWLFAGRILHRDSLGSEQLIEPGQLNLMTAGHGIAHAEETTGVYEGPLHGMQLWVAQPEATRHGPPAFEHHPVLPQVELVGADATVLAGSFLDATSPARRDTDHVGVDMVLRGGTTSVPLDPTFEHAVLAIDGVLTVEGPGRAGGAVVEPGRLAYLGLGRSEVSLDAAEPMRVLLLGGTPFAEPVLMWWNYVARTREEISEAHRAWSSAADRFGHVMSPVPRIDAAAPPWATPPS